MTQVRPALASIVDGLRERRIRDVARAITIVENGGPDAEALMAAVTRGAESATAEATSHRAQTIGLTGSPGVGKSTMTAALIAAFRERGRSVAVLAVDPSSPFSGGALLGDRIRMQSHSADADVFIRSMASRGHLGGLAAAAGQVLRVFDAAGFDVVLIETVGVGQSEVEIAAAADTTVVLVAPGMGDGIQAAKAGILEIGDIFVVNKADREGASSTARELRQMIALSVEDSSEGEHWQPPVLTSVASTGEGVPEVAEAIDEHQRWAAGHGELVRRRRQRAREEIAATLTGIVRRRLDSADIAARVDQVADEVAQGRMDIHNAARDLWSVIGGRPEGVEQDAGEVS
jgi:LAO/AO transport system kinase